MIAMRVCYYKFCYWLGVRLGIRNLEAWAYLHWFSLVGTESILGFFAFSDDYFKFCDRWGIKATIGK